MAQRPISRLHILIVDDNPLLQRGLREMLALHGCRCTAAGDGIAAKGLLRSEAVDLVVTDWLMAPIGGAALVSWIRSAADSPRHDLPIIVLTAQADVPTVRAAWDSGVDAVLAKPATAMDIVRRIEAVLRRPRRPLATQPPAPAGPPPLDREAVLLPPPALLPPALSQPDSFPDTVPRLPSPEAGGGAVRRRQRLAAVLDRVESLNDDPQTLPSTLWQAVADLQHVTLDDAVAASVACSLAACVAGIDPRAAGYADLFQAHLAALRWLLSRGDDRTGPAEQALVSCLRTTTRSLMVSAPASPLRVHPALRFQEPPTGHSV